MANNIQAIFFDFDGVLRDSIKELWIANEHALKAHGIAIPPDEELIDTMHHIKHVHARYASHVPADEFLGTFRDKFVEQQQEIGLYDGTEDLLESLIKSGYKLGLVTSARRSQDLLGRHGLVDKFSVIVGGNDTKEHKPHPEPVLKALDIIGIPPNKVIMIGDMAADIQAARSAKLFATVGITHGVGTKEMLRNAGADYIVDSFEHLKSIIKDIDDGS